jgi:hypothetical protein
LPHYGGEKPGEIDYFSAVTINLFGVVDFSLAPNKITCYGYREFTAKKGRNNVASLLMKELFDKFWLHKGKPGEKLTIAMDNCGGQNKNNFVLRLALYLVEIRYFLNVEIMFYIRGHTKNASDRMFNQKKLKYHKKDIFSWSQALEIIDTKEHVRIVDAQESMFNDYRSLLDKFYGSFKAGTIQNNHIFKVEHTDEKLNMQCAVQDGAPFVNQPMLKRGQVLGGGGRTAAIDVFVVAALKPPDLRPIKQDEFYKKSAHLSLVGFGTRLFQSQATRFCCKSKTKPQRRESRKLPPSHPKALPPSHPKALPPSPLSQSHQKQQVKRRRGSQQVKQQISHCKRSQRERRSKLLPRLTSTATGVCQSSRFLVVG